MFQNTFSPFDLLIYNNVELSLALAIVAYSLFTEKLSTLLLLDIVFWGITRLNQSIPGIVIKVSWLILLYNTYNQVAVIEDRIRSVEVSVSFSKSKSLDLAAEGRVLRMSEKLARLQESHEKVPVKSRKQRNWIQNIIRVLY